MATIAKRILCVDDDADTCAMLSVFLGQAGYETNYAQNIDEGLEKARSGEFSLYLLDLWLGGNDIGELCRRIREFDKTTPIVIYSADARESSYDKLKELDIQAFLTKPRGLDLLVETVDKLLAQSQKAKF